MSKNCVVVVILISVLLNACEPPPPPPAIVPSPCRVVAGDQIGLSISGSFPKDTVVEWAATSGGINPDTGFAVIYTAPAEAGKATITAALVTGETKTLSPIDCEILPPPITETPEIPTLIPTKTETPPLTPTSTETPTLTPTSTKTRTPCEQLRIEDFKLTSPSGLHGDVNSSTPVPPLTFHAPITWEPSHCRLTIQVYRGSEPNREYILYASGELDTVNLNDDPYYRGVRFPLFIRGDWLEIKIFIDGESIASDNVHFKYP